MRQWAPVAVWLEPKGRGRGGGSEIPVHLTAGRAATLQGRIRGDRSGPPPFSGEVRGALRGWSAGRRRSERRTTRHECAGQVKTSFWFTGLMKSKDLIKEKDAYLPGDTPSARSGNRLSLPRVQRTAYVLKK